MYHRVFIVIMCMCSFSTFAASENEQLQREVAKLKRQTNQLKHQLNRLEQKASRQEKSAGERINQGDAQNQEDTQEHVHSSSVTVHAFDAHPESLEFYPTALMADKHIVTYIAGTPIVASPFLGSRPSFDGSDYIVNIPSINRDVRLMQQRRRMYDAYQQLGYPIPNRPIIAISGAVEPSATIGRTYTRNTTSDWNLGSSEIDVAAALNEMVEGYIALAYDSGPPTSTRQRVANSSVFLNMGFVNIGNLDKSPIYLTAGQLFVPFGRFASGMLDATLPTMLARTRSRPIILGYKSSEPNGMFASVYGFKTDTTLGGSDAFGVNWGYQFGNQSTSGEIGASYLSSINDSGGMQFTGSTLNSNNFGGFSSITNGNEAVKKIGGIGVHGSLSIDRFNLTAEWVGTTSRFRAQDLSFNGRGARPSAGQVEAGMTFMAFNRPSSIAAGYQWSADALALNIPQHRISAVFNTSIWKYTIESIEFRHDIDYSRNQFANGAAPVGLVNTPTRGTGRDSDTLIAQIGVYF